MEALRKSYGLRGFRIRTEMHRECKPRKIKSDYASIARKQQNCENPKNVKITEAETINAERADNEDRKWRIVNTV
ncbi:MAG: hypothetical protein ACLSGB_01400 [Dorea sp.]